AHHLPQIVLLPLLPFSDCGVYTLPDQSQTADCWIAQTVSENSREIRALEFVEKRNRPAMCFWGLRGRRRDGEMLVRETYEAYRTVKF
ncbi:MAG: hypothetical protein RLO18_17085, partial [Gimesia chilikensis]